MIRVLIVDDSATARALLGHMLGQDPEIRVVGMATNGQEAVVMANELKPDVITMDVQMPDMDGLEATRLIMAQQATCILIVTAFFNAPELNVVFEAMRAGALDVVAKPAGFGEKMAGVWEHELVRKIKELSGIRPKKVLLDEPSMENVKGKS